MKKVIFLLLFSVLCYFNSISQTLVNAEPYKSQGWLILQPDSQIVTWLIDFYQRVEKTDTSYVDKIIKEVELGDINYVQVPDNYFTDGNTYVYIVKGLNIKKELVVQEGPLYLVPPPPAAPGGGGTTYSLEKSWECVGKTYAWKIEGYYADDNTTSAYFSLETTADYYDAQQQIYIPYYQYMSDNEYMALQGSQNVDGIPKEQYYDVYNWYVYPGSVDIISIPNNPNHPYFNANDGVITSAIVYGVRKSLGPWCLNDPFNLQTTYLNYSYPVFYNFGVSDVINIMNSHSSIYPELDCNAATHIIVPDGPTADEIKGDKSMSIGGGIDIYDYIQKLFPKATDYWWNYIYAVSIMRADSGGFVTSFKTEDFFAPNNEFIGPKFILNPGLYSICLVDPNGFTYPFIAEVKETTINQYELSHFLHVNAYPTPIVENQFTLHLVADAKLKFDYELVDFNGTVLYSKNFVLQKGHDRTHTIKVHDGIPEGILFHHFIFEDGSQISIETCK